MKKLFLVLPILFLFLLGCDNRSRNNESAFDEQMHIEKNQKNLNKVQPSPTITWSMERELLKGLK